MNATLKFAVIGAMSVATLAYTRADGAERTLPAQPRGEVEIVNVAGDVQVRGWDRNEVHVRTDFDANAQSLDVRSDQGRIVISVARHNGRNSGSADLVVQVPRDSSLSVKTLSSDQTIVDVRGAQRLQAVSGTIDTQVWGEDVRLSTISGDVAVAGRKLEGHARINTASGNVQLVDLAGELALETVTGDMDVRMTSLTRARIQTTNGQLRLQAALAPQAMLDAEAINGDLHLVLQPPVHAEFDIETFNGEIDNCFGPKSARSDEFAPGYSLRFKEGNGGARVRVKTLNGGVAICR